MPKGVCLPFTVASWWFLPHHHSPIHTRPACAMLEPPAVDRCKMHYATKLCSMRLQQRQGKPWHKYKRITNTVVPVGVSPIVITTPPPGRHGGVRRSRGQYKSTSREGSASLARTGTRTLPRSALFYCALHMLLSRVSELQKYIERAEDRLMNSVLAHDVWATSVVFSSPC